MHYSLHPQEFREWCSKAQSGGGDTLSVPSRQSATQELLGEHHLMTCVLVSLEEEAGKLGQGHELRPAYWHNAIDFIGNFVHVCHRVKEELHLFPVLARNELISTDFSEAIEKEHERARGMTLSICSSYEEGDWEAVMRLVSLYVYLLRPHMEREEKSFASAAASRGDLDKDEALIASLHELEDKALQGRGRGHYLDVARQMCIGLPIAEQLK